MKYEIINATLILFSHFFIISVPLITGRQLDIGALLIPGLDWIGYTCTMAITCDK